MPDATTTTHRHSFEVTMKDYSEILDDSGVPVDWREIRCGSYAIDVQGDELNETSSGSDISPERLAEMRAVLNAPEVALRAAPSADIEITIERNERQVVAIVLSQENVSLTLTTSGGVVSDFDVIWSKHRGDASDLLRLYNVLNHPVALALMAGAPVPGE